MRGLNFFLEILLILQLFLSFESALRSVETGKYAKLKSRGEDEAEKKVELNSTATLKKQRDKIKKEELEHKLTLEKKELDPAEKQRLTSQLERKELEHTVKLERKELEHKLTLEKKELEHKIEMCQDPAEKQRLTSQLERKELEHTVKLERKELEHKLTLEKKELEHKIEMCQDPAEKQRLTSQLERKELVLDKHRAEVREEEAESAIWTEKTLSRDLVGHREANKLFFLDRSLFDPISSSQAGVRVLYCRDSFNEQWRFLDDRVCKAGCLGWILGPPGTGKTTTTMSFMQSRGMEEGWRVICFRLWKWGIVEFLQVDDGVLRKCEMPADNAGAWIPKFLRERAPSGKKTLVSIDGYRQGEQAHGFVLSACLYWVHRELENRRLVITTSMSSRAKKSSEQDANEKVEEMMVYSWTMEEYLEACRYDAFYKSVADVMKWSLDEEEGSMDEGEGSMDETEQERRSREIESKYQIVGGSCRYMFERRTDEAIQELRDGIEAVPDFASLFDMGMGERANNAVNRLHGKYRVGDEVHWTLVSRFVSMELAQRLGETFVRKIEELVDATGNPTLRGWLFEMLFFARIRGAGLQLTTRSEIVDDWKRCNVIRLEAMQIHKLQEKTKVARVCLKPLKWNQGGYDAVIVDWSEKFVRFVQVTTRQSHDLKLRYMAKCLQLLGIGKEEGWKVEIVFVVPEEILNSFSVKNVENKGILARYGWTRGNEAIEAQVFGMDPRTRR
ncbi:hypothetical protein GUITHDRAFT_118684 [Guillardia theta CCMP2712]|uniref:AAA+ ATPase domain-containing protein n=3 Tax=Guillardia theta TaxID=55529 RepID=L1IGB2_GUITC|nr:hypothetical protein GUITHDRAFT_118684 [Guillardia theta CCMP2712]EKX35137.1 hypothetical protein GUITHDRAFT_118684 [Guillardia theta CCMP2712]|eukprot:XP_005822117.1 hypothetical protein GUITHDRAFT_118684 [Guillardia theta CCMP2712]